VTVGEHGFSISSGLIGIESKHFSCTTPTMTEVALQRTKTPVINSVSFIQIK